jgi:hypothetical protein
MEAKYYRREKAVAFSRMLQELKGMFHVGL